MATLAENLAKGASDLRFLLTTHKVSDQAQGDLFNGGIEIIAQFAAFATDANDLKTVIKDSFGIDPAAGLAQRAQAASFVVAWQAATTRLKPGRC